MATQELAPILLDVTKPQKVSYAVDLWRRDEQIKRNIARVAGRIQPHYALRTEPIAVVGFGPSLNDTWEEIRRFKYIISCSGSHKFLIEKGIVPTWHVDVDPRKHKVTLLGDPHPDVEYLIASTCDPALVAHLDGFNVKLWHVFDTAEEGLRTLPPGEWALTGGCSVGLRALTMARFLGFTDLHVFGIDGSDGPSGKHAAAHPNQAKQRFETIYKGVTYVTTPGFLEAARGTFHELDQMSDVKATFYGDGLVQAMAKDYVPNHVKGQPEIAFVKPELISAEYRALNAKLHSDNIAYGVGGGKHADKVKQLCDTLKTTSVLDYGCQPLDANVLTPTGWRRMGDIRVGDDVIGSSGRSVRVSGTHSPGVVPVYRVTFRDGSSLVVDGNHQWAARTSNHQKRAQQFTVKRTCDLIGDLHWPNAAPLKWRIPMVAPVEFADLAQLERVVHPYLLGLLIGDGNLSQGCAKLFTIDEAIARAASDVLPAHVELAATGSDSFGRNRAYRVVNVGRRRGVSNPITDALRGFGLWGVRAWEKFIPDVYKFAAVSERVALLQGLIDTDGEVGPRWHLSYSTTSTRLADDVAFLVQSLGGTAKIVARKLSTFHYKGERKVGRQSYVVHLKVPPTVTPTRVKRWVPATEYHPNRVIASIDPAGKSEVMGLSVDAADQLYVTEQCIVTHNCGKGYLAKQLPFPIWEYDPAFPDKSQSPRPADLVVCSDVLEHVEPERLGDVLKDLQRCTKQLGYFVIHTGPAKKTLPDGRNTHLIQQNEDWWKKTLAPYFNVAKTWLVGPEIYVLVSPLAGKTKTSIKPVSQIAPAPMGLSFQSLQFRREPYVIGSAANVLDMARYTALARTFPPVELYKAFPGGDKKFSLSERNNPDDYNRFIYSSEMWTDVYKYFKSPTFIEKMLRVLKAHKIVLPYGAHQLSTRFEFSILPADGGLLRPHTDISSKVVTLVIGMPTPDETWDPAWGGGTDVFALKDPTASYLDYEAPADALETAHTYPYQANQCVVFVKSENSWHGVGPLKGEAGKQRRTITVNLERVS